MTQATARLVRINVEDPCDLCGSVFILHKCAFGGITVLHLAEGHDYFFAFEVGKLAGCGTLAVMDAIRSGELRAEKWCGRYVIPQGALLEWLEVRDADGRTL